MAVVYYTQLGIQRRKTQKGLEMPDDKLHGPPVPINSRTGEPLMEGNVDVQLSVRFTLKRIDGSIVPIDNVPARVYQRVEDVLIGGLQALNAPPSAPQPNDRFIALPPPK